MQRKRARAPAASTVQAAQQPNDQNDRKRNPDQPQQQTTAHGVLLTFVAQATPAAPTKFPAHFGSRRPDIIAVYRRGADGYS
jgi:hypothetical protein